MAFPLTKENSEQTWNLALEHDSPLVGNQLKAVLD